MTELKISKYSNTLAVLFALLKNRYDVDTTDGYSQAIHSGCKTWKLILAVYALVLVSILFLILISSILF